MLKKVSWIKVPVYLLAQYLGAFVGSAIAFGLYHESIIGYEEHELNSTVPTMVTAGIFITSPAEYVTLWPAIADQVVSTALLAIGVLYVGDELCFKTPSALKHLLTALLIFSFVTAFSHNAGAILNPGKHSLFICNKSS